MPSATRPKANRQDPDDEEQDLDAGFDPEEVRQLPKTDREYIVPAKDGKGVSHRLQCRVAPEVSRMVADVVQARKYPFRVQGDLVRWCVARGVKLLARGAGVPSVMIQNDIIAQMIVDEEYQIAFQENFKGMERVAQRYIEQGDLGKAREFVTRIRTQVADIPPGHWRDKYNLIIDERYGALLEGAGTVPAGDAASVFTSDDEPLPDTVAKEIEQQAAAADAAYWEDHDPRNEHD